MTISSPKKNFGALCVDKSHLSIVPDTAFRIHEPRTSKRTLPLRVLLAGAFFFRWTFTSNIPVNTRAIPTRSVQNRASFRTMMPKMIEKTILPISAIQYTLSGSFFIELRAHIHAINIAKDLKKIIIWARHESENIPLENGITKAKAKSV